MMLSLGETDESIDLFHVLILQVRLLPNRSERLDAMTIRAPSRRGIRTGKHRAATAPPRCSTRRVRRQGAAPSSSASLRVGSGGRGDWDWDLVWVSRGVRLEPRARGPSESCPPGARRPAPPGPAPHRVAPPPPSIPHRVAPPPPPFRTASSPSPLHAAPRRTPPATLPRRTAGALERPSPLPSATPRAPRPPPSPRPFTARVRDGGGWCGAERSRGVNFATPATPLRHSCCSGGRPIEESSG